MHTRLFHDTQCFLLLFLIVTGPHGISSVRCVSRNSSKYKGSGSSISPKESWLGHAGTTILDDLDFASLCDAGFLTAIRPLTESQLPTEVHYLEARLTEMGGELANQVSGLLQNVQDQLWQSVDEIPSYLAPYLSHGFWSDKGTYTRTAVDSAFNFYLKHYGTLTEKAQLSLAWSLRYMSDHSGKIKTAAIIAGSTLVIGGLVHLWYRRQPNKTSMWTNGTVPIALAVGDLVGLAEVQDQLRQVSTVLDRALSSPSVWLSRFDALQLRCIQRSFLSDILQANRNIIEFAFADIGGMSDEEMLKDFGISSSVAKSIRNALDHHRNPETLNLDLSKLVAASSEDAQIIYPTLAPLSVRYRLASPLFPQVAISQADWKSLDDLAMVVSRWHQALDRVGRPGFQRTAQAKIAPS